MITRFFQFFILFLFACAHSLQAQHVSVENLATDRTSLLLGQGSLWYVNGPQIVKRDPVSGALQAFFDLPNEFTKVRKIALAPNGDLWAVSTQDGVARLDRTGGWKVWSRHTTPLFTEGTYFWDIGVEAANGQVWLSAVTPQNEKRGCFFNGIEWQEDPFLKGINAQNFIGSAQGGFVAWGSDTILLRQGNGWVPIPMPEIGKYAHTFSASFDPQGKLWAAGLGSSALYRYDALDRRPTKVTGVKDYVRTIAFDALGHVYITTTDFGLGRWDGVTWQYYPTIYGTNENGNMLEIAVTPSGQVWIVQVISSTVLTLWENGAPQRNVHDGLVQANQIAFDRLGNLWAGGATPVVSRRSHIDGRIDYFEFFDLPKTSYGLTDQGLRPGQGGDMWCLTDDRKVLRWFKENAWKTISPPSPLIRIEDFGIDAKGQLYVLGTDASNFDLKLCYCDPLNNNSWREETLPAVESRYVKSMVVDEAGNLWFSDGAYLIQRHANGRWERYPCPKPLGSTSRSEPQLRLGPNGAIFIALKEELHEQIIFLRFDPTAATWDDFPSPSYDSTWEPLVWHVDAQGRIWMGINYHFDFNIDSRYWVEENGIWTEIKGIPSLVGSIASNEAEHVYFGNWRSLTQVKTFGYVKGTVRSDIEANCLPSTADQTLPKVVVVASDGAQQYLGISQTNGVYQLTGASDRLEVAAVPPNDLWTVCGNNNIVNPAPNRPANLDLLLRAAVVCPLLEIDLSTPFLRRCAENVYSVSVCNKGTTAAKDAFVDIVLPDAMEMRTSTVAFTHMGNARYRFMLGDFPIGFCSSFNFNVLVKCEGTSIGQALCVSAHVYPDSICTDPVSQWGGATIHLSAKCEGDSMRFTLRNIGRNPTAAAIPYQLFRNDLYQSSGTVALKAQASYNLAIATDGATWRLIAAQEPLHPFGIQPSLAIEACGNAPNSMHGYINSRSNATGSKFEVTDCHILIGSYDPNDKIATPVGVGEEFHQVLPSTPLEYQIRFQNTGTDTAFSVVIRDTLDPVFDLRSFEPLASSHPYRVEAEGRSLAFVFNPIALPDSNKNKLASQGFVRYRIRPKNSTALGTLVTNRAAIYFDKNAPVMTGTVWHLLDSTATTVLAEPQRGATYTGLLRIWPNPAENYFWVAPQSENGALYLYDAKGQLLRHIPVLETKVPIFIPCNGLPNGLYLLRFWGEDGAKSSGKVMVRQKE